MANFNEGDHVKITKIIGNFSKDDRGRDIAGQIGIIENVYPGGMILVRMDAINRDGRHNLFDFVAEQLELFTATTQVG